MVQNAYGTVSLYSAIVKITETKVMIDSMIDRFLGDAFGVLSRQFWIIVLQSGARLPIHTLNYWTEQSVVPGF